MLYCDNSNKMICYDTDYKQRCEERESKKISINISIDVKLRDKNLIFSNKIKKRVISSKIVSPDNSGRYGILLRPVLCDINPQLAIMKQILRLCYLSLVTENNNHLYCDIGNIMKKNFSHTCITCQKVFPISLHLTDEKQLCFFSKEGSITPAHDISEMNKYQENDGYFFKNIFALICNSCQYLQKNKSLSEMAEIHDNWNIKYQRINNPIITLYCCPKWIFSGILTNEDGTVRQNTIKVLDNLYNHMLCEHC